MSRTLATPAPSPYGQLLTGGEPVIAHCNVYNYWLQKTVTLVPDLGMRDVVISAAASSAHAHVRAAIAELGLDAEADRKKLVADTFAQYGYGTLDLSWVTADGGQVRTPTSHYGQLFMQPAGLQRFSEAQNLFDQGYAAGAVAAIYDRDVNAYLVSDVACHSTGGDGTIRLTASPVDSSFESCGAGPGGKTEPPPPNADTNVDEAAILDALSGLDFSGNEEGFIPRFGVMLTFHFANHYNRISFEFIRRMKDSGMLEHAEKLLVDAGHRCAFNTFGGIMTSAEWDAVIRPQCQTREDWVHGMVATVNALGWGVWRVHELVPGKKLVVRIYDDYESRGYLGMYGAAERPVSFLAQGGVAGTMNLIYTGDIASKPDLDNAYYARVFDADDSFRVQQTKSLAMGDAYSEIVAER